MLSSGFTGSGIWLHLDGHFIDLEWSMVVINVLCCEEQRVSVLVFWFGIFFINHCWFCFRKK